MKHPPAPPVALANREKLARVLGMPLDKMVGCQQVHGSEVASQIGMPVLDGDRLHCRKSQYQVKLLHTQGTFFDVLRAKLKWGQR